jgi:2'-5' RNA ligase
MRKSYPETDRGHIATHIDETAACSVLYRGGAYRKGNDGGTLTMRLFVAINFNTETRSRLISLRDDLRSRSLRGNFTLDDNLHLTLVFIGECSAKKLDKVKAILDTVVFYPFEAKIVRLGTFSRGTLWWAGLREDKPLMDLQHEIEHKFALCGFEMDGRKYHPHITLGREVVTDDKPWTIEPISETVTSIELMMSERIGGKLTYTAIYEPKSRIIYTQND